MPQESFEEYIQKRAEKIERIYKEYIEKLFVLKKKQADIINKCIKKLEQKKIADLRVHIKSFKK